MQSTAMADIFVESGLVSEEQLSQALDKQRQLKTQEPVGDLLVSMGLITERDRVRCLGEQWGVPYLDLTDIQIPEEVVSAVTQELARRFKIIPIERTPKKLTLAMKNPLDIFAIDEIRLITGKEVSAVIATEEVLALAAPVFNVVAQARAGTVRCLQPVTEAVPVGISIAEAAPTVAVEAAECAVGAIAGLMAETTHQAFNALHGHRSHGNAGCRLHGTLQKASPAKAAGLLRRAIALRWIALRRNGLLRVVDRCAIARLRRCLLWRCLLRRAKDLLQKAGVVAGVLLRLCQLLVRRLKLRCRLLQRVALHQHRLAQDVERIGIAAKRILDAALGLVVLAGKLGGLHPVDEAVEHLLFLRGHAVLLGANLPRTFRWYGRRCGRRVAMPDRREAHPS